MLAGTWVVFIEQSAVPPTPPPTPEVVTIRDLNIALGGHERVRRREHDDEDILVVLI